MATRKAKPKEFDEAVLQTLVEPITVTLRKIVAGKPSPIELPAGPGEEIGGRGYSADMVRSLPSFISNEWTGGGMYDCTATGANGEQMKWEMYFHPNQVPELIPPTRNQQVAPVPLGGAAQPQMQQAPPPQNSPVMNTSGYLSQVAQTYRQNPLQQPFAGQQAAGSAPAVNPFGWNQQPYGGAPPMRYGAPLGAPSNDAAKEREERLKLEGKMERQAQQAQHDKELTAIAGEMRRFQEQVSKKDDSESPALKAAMDKINAMESQNTTQVLMQQMQAMQENTNRMFERMAADNDRKIEEMRRSAETSKGDPMLPMLMQVMQQQGTAQQNSMQTFVQFMQANQTSQVEAARLNQQNQMGPREMIDLFRSANSGADQMASAYGKAWELMANGVESILQAQGPGVHPALAMLGQAAEGGLGIAQQYIESKQGEAQANAQARSIESQMQAQTRIKTAQIKAQAEVAATRASAPIDIVDESVDGEGAVDEEEIEVAPVAEDVEVAASMEERERELFGEAHQHVMRLRKGVASGVVTSAQTAAAMFQAVEHFGNAAAEGKELPPVFTLFQEQRFADLIDALIPDANAKFRDDASQALYIGVENLKKQAGMQASPPVAPSILKSVPEPEPQPTA